MGGHGHQIVLCPLHNKEIMFYCRSHHIALCDICQHEHYFDPAITQIPVLAGGHYPMGNGSHDIVRIDKFIAETISHMQQQLHTFQVFIQTKKSTGHLMLAGKGEHYMKQYNSEDRIFEEAHNAMVSSLNNYQNQSMANKIAYAAQTLSNFEKCF